jgi:opacity protein-like surface antigen
MYLRLGLGYYKQVIENDENQENPFLNGEISKTWNFQRGSINLTGLSGLTQNDFGAENIGFEQYAAIQGTANYNFTRQIAGDIGAYYRYAHTPAQSDEDDDDDEDTNQYQISAGIDYLPTRWMTIRLGYEFNKYNSSDGDSDDYTENRGLLTITLVPDQPWRF